MFFGFTIIEAKHGKFVCKKNTQQLKYQNLRSPNDFGPQSLKKTFLVRTYREF